MSRKNAESRRPLWLMYPLAKTRTQRIASKTGESYDFLYLGCDNKRTDYKKPLVP